LFYLTRLRRLLHGRVYGFALLQEPSQLSLDQIVGGDIFLCVHHLARQNSAVDLLLAEFAQLHEQGDDDFATLIIVVVLVVKRELHAYVVNSKFRRSTILETYI
jgi:hypothetical protein